MAPLCAAVGLFALYNPVRALANQWRSDDLKSIEDVLRIRDAADSRKSAAAKKMLQEFMTSPTKTGGAR